MGVFVVIILAFFLGFKIYNAIYCDVKDRKNMALRPVLAQQALDAHCKVEKAFILNYLPFIDYLKCLDLYYKKGGKKLTDTELNYFLSYPKHIYLDNNDDVICNGVNIGSIKEGKKVVTRGDGAGCFDLNKIECPLFSPDKKQRELLPNKHLCETDNNSIPFTAFINSCKGNMIINEYKYCHDFTAIAGEGDDNDTLDADKLDKLVRGHKQILENINRDVFNEYEEKYNENKELIDKYLSKELKELYSDFNKEDFKKDELDKKLVDFYARSNIEYLKNHKEKTFDAYNKPTIINNYEGKGWGNAVHELYKRKGSAIWNKYTNSIYSGYYFKNDIEQFENNNAKKVIDKFDLKVNY